MTQPQVSVGIMRAPSVRYELHGAYERIEKHGDTVFRPLSSDSCFTLHDVTIGIYAIFCDNIFNIIDELLLLVGNHLHNVCASF